VKAVVVVIALTSAARAEAPRRAVALAEVIAAARSAPAAPIGFHEAESADASVDAAGAWPAPQLHVATNRLTAKLVTGVVLPLPIFGTIGALREEAWAHAAVVHREARTQYRDLLRRAALAWVALARADAEVEVRTTVAKQAAELERLARGRLDAGAGAMVDVTTAAAARARADVAVSSAKRAQEATAAELAGIVGWDPAQALETTGGLPGTQPVALEALRAHLIEHPERAVALARVGAADATVARIRTLYRPTLALEAQVSFQDPTTPGTDVLGGLVIDVPVFSHVGDQVRAASASTAAERARLAAAEAELAGALVAAYRRWQAAGETVAALERDVVPPQEHAADLAAQAYREGSRDLATALTAQRDLAAVRADLAASRGELAAAWIELEVAAGQEPGNAP
jgi:outer membrane protein, heavy metal efflux system